MLLNRHVCAASVALLLVACSNPDIRVYEVPREENDTPPPHLADAESPSPGATPTDMASQSLPQGSSAEVDPPHWEVPDSWSPAPESDIRRGSFHVHGVDDAHLDIAVTVFPGDVGGRLANVNRWRGQIGLSPIGSDTLSDTVEQLEIDGRPAWLVELQGTDASTIAASVEIDGNSWFFRMTGDHGLASREEPRFREFLESIRFE